MKYSVIKYVNGTNTVVAEDMTIEGAKMKFWEQARILTSAPDVVKATVAIFDEDLNLYVDANGGYREHIEHPQEQPEEQTQPQGE